MRPDPQANELAACACPCALEPCARLCLARRPARTLSHAAAPPRYFETRTRDRRQACYCPCTRLPPVCTRAPRVAPSRAPPPPPAAPPRYFETRTGDLSGSDRSPYRAVMENTGNFAVYDSKDTLLWETGELQHRVTDG